MRRFPRRGGLPGARGAPAVNVSSGEERVLAYARSRMRVSDPNKKKGNNSSVPRAPAMAALKRQRRMYFVTATIVVLAAGALGFVGTSVGTRDLARLANVGTPEAPPPVAPVVQDAILEDLRRAMLTEGR